MRRTPGPPPRLIAFVGYPDLQVLDLVGPLEVFNLANRFAAGVDDPERPAYRTTVVTADGAPVRSSSGLVIGVDSSTRDLRGPVDTVVVVGGTGTEVAVFDDRLVAFLRSVAPHARRVTSVCSGAFLLARAGILDGRRATTHWSECDRLEQLFPTVHVERDPIFVRDGPVWTSAGITAGMDLALALVEEDLGPDLARQVARWMVLFVQRPGGQAQFSAQLAAQQPQRQPLRELAGWMPEHLAEDLSVTALATRVAMSPRHFARVFRAELGTTPASYVEGLRVEAARRLLESTDQGLGAIARSCGFGTVETFHRSFRRALGVTPGAYRARFSTVATSA